MKKRLTEHDLIGLRDTFSDLEGQRVSDAIDDATVFPIAGGPWPSEFAAALRVQCTACQRAVGISPKGWEYHRSNPARKIFCPSCFVLLHNLMVALKPGISDD
jgi:hypothetical protein